MALALNSAQGELSPLEIGMHVFILGSHARVTASMLTIMKRLDRYSRPDPPRRGFLWGLPRLFLRRAPGFCFGHLGRRATAGLSFWAAD
jgi:hypothetical protein